MGMAKVFLWIGIGLIVVGYLIGMIITLALAQVFGDDEDQPSIFGVLFWPWTWIRSAITRRGAP